MDEDTMDELDDILNSIEEPKDVTIIEDSDTDIEEVKSKEIVTSDGVDVTEFESLANKLMDMTMDDRKLADKTFELFYPDIAMGRDKTKGSAEAITKAVELKIAAGRNIIDIMKLLKEDKKGDGTNIGIFMNSKKSGINLENIITEIDD